MKISLTAMALTTMLVGILAVVKLGQAAGESETMGKVAPLWTVPLTGTSCPWSATDTNCHSSSPAIADVNQDGRKDVVLATNNGHVMAVSGSGSLLWSTDVSPAFGRPPKSLTIASSPAVADIDQDGRIEVVIGSGFLYAGCHPGGVVVLEDNGQIKSNWPKLAHDHHVPPGGCPDPIYSSPALGDLDNNGDMEIVVGGFDNRIYAWHHDGQLLPGFPANSALFARLGWATLVGSLADTVWSSPALADMDGDGFLDIVIGTDEGNLDARYGGNSGGWTCPYTLPPGWTPGYCGGSLYVLNRFGQLLPGFPIYIHETIQSTPALYDINLDNRPEIFVGTGNFYFNNSPDHPTHGFRLFAFDSQGKAVPGWQGGKVLGGATPASPSVGDIAGDASPEIVISAMDKRLYAFHHNGQPVSGFPMTPRNQFGEEGALDVGKTPILADFDGDGKMEIGLTLGWSPVIIDGDGRILTNTDVLNDPNTPHYLTDGLLMNNLAVGDLDSDGNLEMVAHNSKLYAWDLPSGAKKAHWPMFKFNPARTSANLAAQLSVSPQQINLAIAQNQTKQFERQMTLHVPGTSFTWQAGTNEPQTIKLPASSGSATNTAVVPVQITTPAGLNPGMHQLGIVELTVQSNNVEIGNSQQSVVVNLDVWNKVHSSFLPLMYGN